jgi:hypothetical protein
MGFWRFLQSFSKNGLAKKQVKQVVEKSWQSML